jgi:transcriptional regulator with XRE-family HTH domain
VQPPPTDDGSPALDATSSDDDLGKLLGRTIAQRVREYRLQLGLTVAQLADRGSLSKGMLSKIENAQTSPSLATLARLAEALAVPVTAFFRGLDEESDVLHVKAGNGLEIQDRLTKTSHRYQNLGVMRTPHDRLEPLLVTLLERSEVFPLYQHPGTELIYVLEGTMEYSYGQARYLLEPGDTLQFNGAITHGPSELLDLPVRFLSIKSRLPSSELA